MVAPVALGAFTKEKEQSQKSYDYPKFLKP